MDHKSIMEIGEKFGLTIEPSSDSESETDYKIYKGVNQIFNGNENAVRSFLSTYEAGRPPLFDGSK